jgi:integrase/recombinase XerD
LSLEEIGRLLRAAATRDTQARWPWPERDIALLSSFLGTGIRPGEAVALVVDDLRVCQDGGRLHIRHHGVRERELLLPDVVTASLRLYLDDRTARLGRAGATSALFVRPNGDTLTPVGLNYIVGRWFRRAGVPEPHGSLVYTLRHTYATLLSDAGVEIEELQRLLGHRHLSTTSRYARKSAVDPGMHIHANPTLPLLAAAPLSV